MRVAGVMSGTSLDGIDVAVVEIRGQRVETVGFLSVPYPGAVRSSILAVSGGAGGGDGASVTAEISRLNFQLGELYSKAILKAVRRFGPVELIGCHGQTVYHAGGVHTLQIGEAGVVAERTGVPVVSNFRSRDIAAGGQGAPLVPFVDYLLFRHARRTRVALNIGGIANITVIPAGARPEQVVAFDTGPGNMVIDALAREFSKGALAYDRNGKIAESGTVLLRLLDQLIADPYFRRTPPKSAGREQYGAEFVGRMKRSGSPLRDLITTATVLTAATVAIGVRMACGTEASIDLIASGGGAHNPEIMGHIAGFLPQAQVLTSSDFGVDIDAKEAIAFAVLAHRTWRRQPANLPSATGAGRSVILGDLTI